MPQPPNDLHIDVNVVAIEQRFARVHDYLGPWTILPEMFLGVVDRVSHTDLLGHVMAATHPSSRHQAAAPRAAAPAPTPARRQVAVLSVSGMLMKHASSLEDSTSTVEVRRQIRDAARDAAIDAIVLRIDSPGGTAAGTDDLARDVAAAAAIKPVYAYCEDLCASAAYWVASQATRVLANPSAVVGSIGTYAVLHDASKMAEKQGVAVHVVRAGEFKGAGTLGTAITEEHIGEMQRLVDELNSFFTAGVATARGFSAKKMAEIADGRVHVGAAAQALGLIDGIAADLDAVLAEIDASFAQPSNARPAAATSVVANASNQGEPIMAKNAKSPRAQSDEEEDEETAAALAAEDEDDPEDDDEEEEPAGRARVAPAPASAAASIAELKAACPGASAETILGFAEAGLTVAQAKQLAGTVGASSGSRHADRRDAARRGFGVQPTKGGAVASGNALVAGDPIEAFNAEVDKLVATGLERPAAHLRVCRDHPDLRQAMVAAHNAAHPEARGAAGAMAG